MREFLRRLDSCLFDFSPRRDSRPRLQWRARFGQVGFLFHAVNASKNGAPNAVRPSSGFFPTYSQTGRPMAYPAKSFRGRLHWIPVLHYALVRPCDCYATPRRVRSGGGPRPEYLASTFAASGRLRAAACEAARAAAQHLPGRAALELFPDAAENETRAGRDRVRAYPCSLFGSAASMGRGARHDQEKRAQREFADRGADRGRQGRRVGAPHNPGAPVISARTT